MKKIKLIPLSLLLLSLQPISAYAFTDDACKLYLCLMGTSEADGGSDCVTRITQLRTDLASCHLLPVCIGTSGPVTSGLLMMNYGSTQGPENGPIILTCETTSSWPSPPTCEYNLTSPAVIIVGEGFGNC